MARTVAGTRATTFVDLGHARRWGEFDWQLLLAMLLLIGLGVVLGVSADWDHGPAMGGTLSQPVKTVIWAAIGLIVFGVAAATDYHWLRTFAPALYVGVLGLLMLNLAVGGSTPGHQLSVSIGGLDFQFSEIAKVLIIAVLASFLVSRGPRIGRASTIAGASLLVAVPTLLVLRQPDLGTAVVFIAVLAVLLFTSGASLGWLALLGAGAVAAAPVVVASLEPYQRSRLLCFLDPQADVQGACYQLIQSLNAVGSGGWLGQGLTAGRQNQLGYLPVQTTDFVFTVAAEELGFVGGVVLLSLFGLLMWRVMTIGWRARDDLGRLLAAGVGGVILFQVAVNVGMVTGVMPVIGIPLPLISYGGSSMVSLLFGLGIVQSVRMHSRRERF